MLWNGTGKSHNFVRDDREPRKIHVGDRGTVAGPWRCQEQRDGQG